jgi:hypothetical protein
MTPENRNCSLQINGSVTGSSGNEHAGNNKRTAVSMQRRGKRTSISIEELLGNGVFCWSRPEAIERRSHNNRKFS